MTTKVKQGLWLLLPIIFILIIFGIPTFLGLIERQISGELTQPSFLNKNFEYPPSESEIEGKEVVRVGIYILRISDFNAENGTYQIDLYLNFVCQTINCDPSDFEIPNATSFPEIEDQTYESVRGTEYYYRIRTALQSPVAVKYFPFDIQTLTIEFEDKYRASNEYIYIPDPNLSGIDPQGNIPGWSTISFITGSERDHNYDVYDESYSRAVFTLGAYNPIWESLLRTILPVIVISFAGIISFFMKYDRAADRLGVVSSSLVSAVLLNLSFPKGATYMSTYMLANYLILVSALVITVRLMALVNENKLDQAKKLHDITDNIFPIIWLIVQIVFVGYGLWVFNLISRIKLSTIG